MSCQGFKRTTLASRLYRGKDRKTSYKATDSFKRCGWLAKGGDKRLYLRSVLKAMAVDLINEEKYNI